MKRRPHRRNSASHKINGKKKPNTAHGRPRLAGVKSLRGYLRLYGRGASGREGREEFAKRVGTSLPYLQHLVLGNRQASMEMAAKIEAATHGIVKAEELHPSPAWAMLRARAATTQLAGGR